MNRSADLKPSDDLSFDRYTNTVIWKNVLKVQFTNLDFTIVKFLAENAEWSTREDLLEGCYGDRYHEVCGGNFKSHKSIINRKFRENDIPIKIDYMRRGGPRKPMFKLIYK